MPTSTPVAATTTTADGVEFLVAQVAIAPDGAGPDAYYRLRNAADADRTVAVETTLAIEGGGTYTASGVARVPAGGETTLRYRIVAFDDLSDVERSRVRQGEGVDLTVRVNGRVRPDV